MISLCFRRAKRTDQSYLYPVTEPNIFTSVDGGMTLQLFRPATLIKTNYTASRFFRARKRADNLYAAWSACTAESGNLEISGLNDQRCGCRRRNIKNKLSSRCGHRRIRPRWPLIYNRHDSDSAVVGQNQKRGSLNHVMIARRSWFKNLWAETSTNNFSFFRLTKILVLINKIFPCWTENC